MILQIIQENAAWTQTTWKSAFNMQWRSILFVTAALAKTFNNPEVLIGNKNSGGSKIDVLANPPEQEMLVLRGDSKILKGKTSITFYTKTNTLTITIPKSLDLGCEYESLAKALGTFADSIELKMYAAR